MSSSSNKVWKVTGYNLTCPRFIIPIKKMSVHYYHRIDLSVVVIEISIKFLTFLHLFFKSSNYKKIDVAYCLKYNLE